MRQLITILWLEAVALTALSLMWMGAELRSRSVLLKWRTLSLNPVAKIREQIEVIASYWEFKREQHEFPIYIWTIGLFGPETLLIPLAGLLYFLRE